MFITAYDVFYEPLKKEFLGVRGPSGTNQMNSTNLYFVFGNVSTLPNPPNLISTVRSVATRDSGDVVFEGGYQTLLPFYQSYLLSFMMGLYQILPIHSQYQRIQPMKYP